MSKGYTITFFINEIQSKVSSKNSVSAVAIANAISPNNGLSGVKLATLNDFVGNYYDVVNGTGKYAGFGKTPRTRLLKALKLRKKHGFAA